jgi:hypothetical protein
VLPEKRRASEAPGTQPLNRPHSASLVRRSQFEASPVREDEHPLASCPDYSGNIVGDRRPDELAEVSLGGGILNRRHT